MRPRITYANVVSTLALLLVGRLHAVRLNQPFAFVSS